MTHPLRRSGLTRTGGSVGEPTPRGPTNAAEPGTFARWIAGAIMGIALPGVLLLSCAGDSVLPPAGDRLALGTWGGEGSGVIVTESGTHVHVGCTFGDIAGEVPLDGEGRFTVEGSYVLRAFPVVVGPELPAHFSGRVRGRVLQLAVAVNDTVEGRVVALGPVTAVLGHEPELDQCPICRVPRPRGVRSPARP